MLRILVLSSIVLFSTPIFSQFRFGIGLGINGGWSRELLYPDWRVPAVVGNYSYVTDMRGFQGRLRVELKYGLGVETGAYWLLTSTNLSTSVKGYGSFAFKNDFRRIDVPISLNWRPSIGRSPTIWPWIQVGQTATFQEKNYYSGFRRDNGYIISHTRDIVDKGIFLETTLGIGFEARVNDHQRIGALIRKNTGLKQNTHLQYHFLMVQPDPNGGPDIIFREQLSAVKQSYGTVEVSWVYLFGGRK